MHRSVAATSSPVGSKVEFALLEIRRQGIAIV
jgi:hypothetical protein